MAKSIQSPEIHRGATDVRMPGLGPEIMAALDAQNIQPHVSGLLTLGPQSTLLYFHTPVRIRLHSPAYAWRRLEAGTALLLGPGSRWQIDTRPAKGPSWHTWAGLNGLMATPLVAFQHPTRLDVEFRDESNQLADQFAALIDVIEANKAKPYWCMQVEGRKLLDLLYRAEREAPGQYRIISRSRRVRPDPWVGRAVAYMEEHMGDKVTLADLARHLNAGASTISHRFRAHTGEAPMQTLKRMRLIRARIMLLQGHRVADIAEALGFYDEHHFSLAFKATEGISPRAFIKRERGAAPKPVGV